MALDTRRYEEEVVRPLRGKAARLPDDLLTRYAVDPTMSAGDLEKRLRDVRAYWHNKARSNTNVGQVCKAFVRADEVLRVEHGDALLDPAWWRRRAAHRDRSRQAALAPLVEDLRRFYGDLGALTAEQLAAVGLTHPDASDAEVDAAREEAGLALVDARELPRRSGLDGDAYRAVVKGLVDAGVSSIPELLHPGCADIRLLDGFRATPRPAGGLDAAAVAARAEAVARGRDTMTSGPTKHALGRLRIALDQGVDLRVLSLVHLLDATRRHRAAGAVPSGLVRLLRQAGVAEDEARTLVVQVLAEGAQAADPLDELRAALAEGRVVAAARLLGGLEGEAATEGRALVERRNAEVDGLREQATAALAAGRPDLAEQRLQAAHELATDRDDLGDELARLPLAAVVDARAEPDGTGVRISWTAPPSHGAHTHYRVVRRTDRVPRDVADGAVLVPTEATHCADPAAPVGREVHYAVVASRRVDGPWSAPATATVSVVPPPVDVVVVGERGAVAGRWAVHADALRVRVRRSDRPPGRGVETVELPAGPRSFTDTAVVDDTDYFYELAAVYVDHASGGELVSSPVVVRSGLRAASAPVSTVTVCGDPDDDAETRVLVRWRPPPGAQVEVRAARTPAPGEWGDRLGVAEVDAWGPVLDGVPRDEGDWTTLRVAVPAGRLYYATWTHDGDERIRGEQAAFDLVARPRRVTAQRRGESTVLAWVWPEGARVAEIRWPGGRVRTTLAEYRESGGVHLPLDASGEVEVRAVSGSGPDAAASGPVTVRIEAPRRTVRYSLERVGSRWRGTRECVVSVPPGQGAGPVELVLVAAPGRTMPLTADAGEVLARGQVDLADPEPTTLRAPFPRLRGPFWLRCFSGRDDVVLVDPPVDELKVT